MSTKPEQIYTAHGEDVIATQVVYVANIRERRIALRQMLDAVKTKPKKKSQATKRATGVLDCPTAIRARKKRNKARHRGTWKVGRPQVPQLELFDFQLPPLRQATKRNAAK